MAKIAFLLGLAACLLHLLSRTIALEITDIFNVQPGASDGGCDDRAGVLDQWLSEGIESLDVALKAINNYRKDPEVRKSLSTIFGIRNDQSLTEDASVALNRVKTSDYQGKDILDQNGNPIRIMDIPKYDERLAGDPDNKPWWSGELTALNSYYFTEHGGNYCHTDELGLTAKMEPFRAGANGQAEAVGEIAGVILCPYSFEGSSKPDSYKEASNRLVVGQNLADAIPKSATLLHEAFHALFGVEFLAGDAERYDIAACLSLANSQPGMAQVNPENYIFFIAHMYHLRGEDGNEPWSIPTQWDFKIMGRGRNRILGAFRNPIQANVL
ncbi:hypothetical protein PG984_010845 [Apiospora sp. TS-2023a]